MRRLPLILLAALTLHGCSRPQAGDPSPVADRAPSYVEVVNHFALSVEIFVSGGGSVQRLGTVHPGMNGHFTLPRTFGNGTSVEFRADPGPGHTMYRSAQMLIQPGAIVDFEVASVLFNSTAVIRP
jgi:hypothetical protein